MAFFNISPAKVHSCCLTDHLGGTLDSDLSDPGTTGSNFGGSMVGRWYALAVPEDLRSVEAPLAEAEAEAEAEART